MAETTAEPTPIRASICLAAILAAAGCGGSVAVGASDDDAATDSGDLTEVASETGTDAAHDVTDADVDVASDSAVDTVILDSVIDSVVLDSISDTIILDSADAPSDLDALDSGPPDTPCSDGATRCGWTCTDLASDPANCGACGASCASGKCEARECILGTSCLDVLTHGRSTGDGKYWIDPGAGPLRVSCNMTIDGGGWTQLVAVYASQVVAGTYRYLYLDGSNWYESPSTSLVWDWGVGQQLTGTYSFLKGTTSGEIVCSGSSETPMFGVGCSNGPGPTAKVLPYYTLYPTRGDCEVCQDVPDAFGVGACTAPSAVSVFIR